MNIRTLLIIVASCNFMHLHGAQIMVPLQGDSSEFAYNIATSDPVSAQGRTETMPDQITESINPYNSIRTITKISEKIENDQSIITTETWTSKQVNYLTWTNAGLAAGALGIGAATYYGLSNMNSTQPATPPAPAQDDNKIDNQVAPAQNIPAKSAAINPTPVVIPANNIAATQYQQPSYKPAQQNFQPTSQAQQFSQTPAQTQSIQNIVPHVQPQPIVQQPSQVTDQSSGFLNGIGMQDIALGAAALGTGFGIGAAMDKMIDYRKTPLTDAQLAEKYKRGSKARLDQRALKQGNWSATDNFNYGNYASEFDDYDNNIIDEDIKLGQKLTNPQLRAQAQKIERRLQQKHNPSPSKAYVPVENVQLIPDNQGYPTIDSIKDLMIKEYFGEDKRNRVTVNIINGGAFTGKMYQILFNGKPKFFLKMPFVGAMSHERLINIQQSSLGRLGIKKCTLILQKHYEYLKKNYQS